MVGVEYPAWLGITPCRGRPQLVHLDGKGGTQSAGAPGMHGAQAPSPLSQTVTADPATWIARPAWRASTSAQGVLYVAVSLGLQLRSSGGMSTICNRRSRFRHALPGLLVLGPRLSRGGWCEVKAAARPAPTSASHPRPRSRLATQGRTGTQPAGATPTRSRERGVGLPKMGSDSRGRLR
jgi:hypothetical protein